MNPFVAGKVTGVQVEEQRYFRIPFSRPVDPFQPNNMVTGWWLAHFDGKWIARQMEIYPNRPAVLLVAGVDDMKMCEMTLPQTGLTVKQNAEILEQEFEQEWNRNGGAAVLQVRRNQVSSKYLQMKLGVVHN